MSTDDEQRKVADLVEKAKIAQVTTVADDGTLVSRPLAVQQRGAFDGELYFFTRDPSPKTDEVRANDQVNVAFEAGGGYLSVSGTATVSQDAGLIDELWGAGAEAWFEGGRDDPEVAVLTVHADTAEYWTIDSPKVVTYAKYAKALVTGQTPDVGENAVVDL